VNERPHWLLTGQLLEIFPDENQQTFAIIPLQLAASRRIGMGGKY
jgi:hypothetical protein